MKRLYPNIPPSQRRVTPSHAVRLGAILLLAMAAMLLARGLGAPVDVDHYVFWTKLVTEGGVQSAYSGTFPHTYAVYPPFTLYFYWGAGQAYRQFIDPAFEIQRALGDPTLTFLLRIPGMLFHLLTVALIYNWLKRWQGSRPAWIGALVYALQPGVLFDTAVWGQPDSVHSFFVLLAVVLLLDNRPGWAGAGLGLAAMTKPQTWILLPILALYIRRRYGWLRAANAGVAALLVALFLALPFFVYGSWKQLIRLPESIAKVAPWVSANAHNLWWLILGEQAITIPDFDPSPLGPSWVFISTGLVGLSVLFCLARLQTTAGTGWRSLPSIVAFQSFAFFFLVTKAHENHAFIVLPVLSILWLRHRGIAALYLAMSITFLLNLVLHDPALAPQVNTAWLNGQIKAAQSLNAAANLLLLAAWATAILVTGREKLSPNRAGRD
jgi:dolichyl-phosphate-mannose-protein mannosyltransferase